MSTIPLVSIIIPTLNRAHLISDTLDSILNQTYTNWECIIVDDGSTDNTEALVQEYINKDNRFRYFNRPKNHLPGGNGARNYGFTVSKGDYIQWFDSDDIMLPKKLELKMNAIKQNNVDFVVCKNAEIYSIDPYKIRMRWPISLEGDVLLNHLKGAIAFTTAGPLFKRSYLSNKLLFDENVLIGQEWEFFSRLLAYKPNIDYLDEVLYHFKNISGGIRNNKTKIKIFNRFKTEISLYKYINKSKYFIGSVYLEAYNRYKFFSILNHYKLLRNNFPNSVLLPCLISGLKTVKASYYFNSVFKIISKPKILKVILKDGK